MLRASTLNRTNLVQPHEDSVVNLPQSEKLKDFLDLWGHTINTEKNNTETAVLQQ